MVPPAQHPRALEAILRRELKPPLRRTNRVLLGDLSEPAVCDTRIRIAVADDVESIERIEPEAEGLFPEGMELLERRHIHVKVAGPRTDPLLEVPNAFVAARPNAH